MVCDAKQTAAVRGLFPGIACWQSRHDGGIGALQLLKQRVAYVIAIVLVSVGLMARRSTAKRPPTLPD
jgi:hypothetical protein